MANHQVFISYAWGGESEEFVNQLDSAFQEKGIVFIRDKRDLGFKGMITDFMKQIGTGNAVITVISDKYLKSPYCMYELLEIYRNLNLAERIFPVVLSDALIFEPIPRLQYLKYWQDKKKELDEAIMQFGVDAIAVIGDDYKTYKKIFDNFGEVVNILKDINSLTPQMHKDDHFNAIITAVEKLLILSTNQTPQTTAKIENIEITKIEVQPQTSVELPKPTVVRIHNFADTDPFDKKFNIKNINNLLNNAFNDTDFQQFCMINFDEVYNGFGESQNKTQKVMKLIDYCRRNLKFQYLLENIKEQNPVQFERFMPYIT